MEKELIAQKAVDTITHYLGPSTGNMYKEFFEKKDEKAILMVTEELLSDIVGPENAKKQITSFINNTSL